MAYLRQLVSKKKRRYQEDGFDLDLSYITPRMIAMGYPSESVEGLYRNPREEVYRFLETRHKGHYHIYNLCSERNYDASKFNGAVSCFPFDDHNAPPLLMIEPFCKHVQEHLGKDPANVAVVHCKAGKGRTGVMISAWLLFSKQWSNADEALRFFAAARTEDQKGVTIPSQNRYVHYFDYSLKNSLPPARPYAITRVRFFTTPKYETGPSTEPWFRISSKGQKVYSGKPKVHHHGGSKRGSGAPDEIVDFNLDLPVVCGDVKVQVYDRDRFGNVKEELFHFWFNTGFVSPEAPLLLEKGQIDKAIKDKHHKKFRKEFRVEVAFEETEEEELAILDSDDDAEEPSAASDLAKYVRGVCEEACPSHPTYRAFCEVEGLEEAVEFGMSVVGRKSSSARGGGPSATQIQHLTKAIISCTDRISQHLHDMAIEGHEDSQTIQVADDIVMQLRVWNTPAPAAMSLSLTSSAGGSAGSFGPGSGTDSAGAAAAGSSFAAAGAGDRNSGGAGGRRHSSSKSSYIEFGVSLVAQHAQSVQSDLQGGLAVIINQLKVDNSFDAVLGVAGVCDCIQKRLRASRKETVARERAEKAQIRARQRAASMVNTEPMTAAAAELDADKESSSKGGLAVPEAGSEPSSPTPSGSTSMADDAQERLHTVRKAVHATCDVIEVRFDSLRARVEAAGPEATKALADLVREAIDELVGLEDVDAPSGRPTFEIPDVSSMTRNAELTALARQQIDGGIAYLGRHLQRVRRAIDNADVAQALQLAKTVRVVLKLSEVEEG